MNPKHKDITLGQTVRVLQEEEKLAMLKLVSLWGPWPMVLCELRFVPELHLQCVV